MLSPSIIVKSPHQAASLPTLTSSPKPDIFFSLQGRLVAAHRRKLTEIAAISRVAASKHTLILDDQLSIAALEHAIAYFYGATIKIPDLESLRQMLSILASLQAQALITVIENAIVGTLKQYDTFALFQVAHTWGLPSLAMACFSYLQNQQFQQCKYHLYSFLQCQFKLFQIVLRRHHRLKQSKQIQGLDADTINDFLTLYCRRNHYDNEILQKLRENYVLPWRQVTLQAPLSNASVRFHKPHGKNIGQSTTIYGNDSLRRSKQSQSSIMPISNAVHLHGGKTRPQSHPTSIRKYSMEIEKALGDMGLHLNFLKHNIQSVVDIQPDGLILEEDQYIFNQIKKEGQREDNVILDRAITKPGWEEEKFEDEISQIGIKGSIELKIHEVDCQMTLRQNTKSMIFAEVIQEEIEESMEQKSRKNTKNHRRIARLSLQNSPFIL